MISLGELTLSDFRVFNSVQCFLRVLILTFVSASDYPAHTPVDDLSQNPPPYLETLIPVEDISTFLYGEHEEGEQLSFIYNGVIPAFKPNYNISVKTYREDLQKNYTYLRVEYYNVLSEANVEYNAIEQMVTFHIKYPFVETMLGIVGFALPLDPTQPLPTMQC